MFHITNIIDTDGSESWIALKVEFTDVLSTKLNKCLFITRTSNDIKINVRRLVPISKKGYPGAARVGSGVKAYDFQVLPHIYKFSTRELAAKAINLYVSNHTSYMDNRTI